MPLPRANVLRVSLVTLLFLLVIAATALVRKPGGEGALATMPVAERAYWTWVKTVNRTPAEAIERGRMLLEAEPDLRRLYLRLAELCLAQEAVAQCAPTFEGVAPTAPRSALYRAAALALLTDEDAAWDPLASAEALDPTLARRLVDRTRFTRDDDALARYEAAWTARLAVDSTAAGAAFGLGYAAVLRGAWEEAERLLLHTARVRPDDAEAYRELGRVYYVTGQPERFTTVLMRGIRIADAAHDLEQQTILRGNLGLNLLQRGSLAEAEALFKVSLATSRVLSDGATEGFNLYRLASVRLQQHRYDEVFTLLDSAAVRYTVHAPRQAPEVRALRGTTYSDLYRFTDAEQELERAIAEASAHRNLGVEIQASVALAQVRYRMGRYAAGRETALQVLELAQQYRQTAAEIGALVALGDIEQRWGNFEQATGHYTQAAAVAERAQDGAQLRSVNYRLGHLALNAGHAEAAEGYFNALETPSDASDVAAEGHNAFGLSYVYRQFSNYEEAIRLVEKAASAFEATGDQARLVDALLFNVWLLIEQEEERGVDPEATYLRAAPLLDRAERLARAHYPSALFFVAAARGGLELNRGAHEAARDRFEEALHLERQARYPYMQVHVLHGLALAQWRLGEATAAERSFTQAVSTVEAMRDNLRTQHGRAAFVQDKAIVVVYKSYAAFLADQGRTAEAFHYVERSRSRSLADLLHTSQYGRSLEQERSEDRLIEAQRQKTAIVAALAGEADPWSSLDVTDEIGATRAGYLRQEYLRADSIYEASLQLSGPSHGMAEMLTAVPLLADSVQMLLEPGEALVSYSLHQRTDGRLLREKAASMVFVITRDAVHSVPLDVDLRALAERVTFFRDQLNAPDGSAEQYEATSRRLYSELITPLRRVLPAHVTHLHLVPEGVLHYLPFGALQDEAGRFLMETFTLSVSPSASVLKISRARNPRLWRSILLVADPNGRLPGTREEAEAIEAIQSFRALPLVGARATLANVKAFANSNDVIHFATHGTFSSQSPLSSYLELHGDDKLGVDDIGALDLNAYLVTLSACETGLSGGLDADIPRGDEWVGLNQAFLAAGTPTVMASLWPIDDQVSSEFMISFYKHLQNGKNKSEALAEVQRTFARRGDVQHPFYWAAFTVIGDPL